MSQSSGHPSEHELRLAAIRARLDQIDAGLRDISAHRIAFHASCARVATALTDFLDAFQTAFEQPFTEHPDLVELDVTLDGFYGDES